MPPTPPTAGGQGATRLPHPPPPPRRAPSPASATLAALATVRNARDLADAWPEGGLAPGRLLRSACPAGAADADVAALRRGLRVAALLDLRSDAERADDPRCLLLHAGDAVTTRFVRSSDEGSRQGARRRWWPRRWWARPPAVEVGPPSGRPPADAAAPPVARLPADVAAPAAPGEPGLAVTHVSLLDKRRFYRALLARLPAPTAARVTLLGLVSRSAARAAAMDAINAGGLAGMYACMLDSSAPEFAAAARAVGAALAARAPLLFFCRVGKDRTGLLAALLLALAGAPDAAIAADYAASDGTVAAIALGGLEAKDRELAGLDTAVFAAAPRDAILAALHHVRSMHGGVESYLESGGFGRDEQRALVAGWRAAGREGGERSLL